MTTMYKNNLNLNINVENIKKQLDSIIIVISKPQEYVSKKIKTKEINDQINRLIKSTDKICELLKEDELFYDEYYDFCEIQDIVKITLNRELIEITSSDLNFISRIFNDFFEFIECKIQLIDNDDLDKIESEYNSYLTLFNNSKIYFYGDKVSKEENCQIEDNCFEGSLQLARCFRFRCMPELLSMSSFYNQPEKAFL